MRKIKLLLFAAAMSYVTMLNSCVEDPPPVAEKPDTPEEILAYLKSLDIYDIGEHLCVVDTSTDGYEYQFSLSDTAYYYLSGAQKVTNNRIPTGLTDNMSTLGLMETILENPVWYSTTVWGEHYIWEFLSTNDSLNTRFENMNPGLLDKFYGRDEAASSLVERYTNMYPSCSENNFSSGYGKGDYLGHQLSATFMEIQLLMAEDPILNQLTEEELRKVSIHIVKTYIALMENTGEDIILLNTRSLAWLATRIMESRDYQPINQLYTEWHNSYRLAISRFLIVDSASYAQLMLCLNDFIHDEL